MRNIWIIKTLCLSLQYKKQSKTSNVMIKIPKREKVNDSRSILANKFCDFIMQSCNNDLDAAVADVISNKYYDLFDNCMRNFYETVDIDKEIPLFVYAENLKHGKDLYGVSDEEHAENLEICRSACIEYYMK